MLQRFLYYKGEVRTLGAIAVKILAVILVLSDRIVEHFFRLIDLHPYFRQECHFKRRTVFFYQCADIHPVKLQGIVVIYVKSFLWKMEGLVYEISVCIIHL